MWSPPDDDVTASPDGFLYSAPGGNYYTEVTSVIDTAADGEARSRLAIYLLVYDAIKPLTRNGAWRTPHN